MAGKPKRMSQIKQLLRLHESGKSKKEIARVLGISKNTVKSYLFKAAHTGSCIDELMSLEDPELEAKFFAGNPSYKDNSRYALLKKDIDYYISELQKTGVNKRLLWEEYRMAHPDGYGYSQFCYHLSQQKIASNPSMVLSHLPGEKLYIDFAGKTLSYTDADTGEIIECQVFVACLPYSDFAFVMAVRSQSLVDFIFALTQCLLALGGVPEVIVPDNLKSAVTKASRYEPGLNQVMEDFANHYGTTVVPARARKPRDKALVENQVKLIYTRVYAKLRHQQFFDLTSLNKAIAEKVLDHNQTRMQQKPYCREERFLSDERHKLKPLPEKVFEIKYYRELKIANNNHIYLSVDKHYYSVPYIYIGQKAKVIYTRSLVCIFVKGRQVATHLRNYQQGGYTTTQEHLCSHHNYYLNRSPDYYKNRAEAISKDFYQLLVCIFDQDRYPEQLYRTCDGLFSLQRKTGPEQFNMACKIALENQNYTYRFILNIIENKMTTQYGIQQELPLPGHDNTRGKEYYK